MRGTLGWTATLNTIGTVLTLIVVLVGVIVAAVFGFLGIRAVRQSTNQALEQRLVLAQATAGQIDYLLHHSLDHLATSTEGELHDLMSSAAVSRLYASQKRNLPVTYVLYPDEGHGFKRPQNSLSFSAVAEAFLARHLGGAYEPIGADFTGSSIQVPVGAEQIGGLYWALSRIPPENEAKGDSQGD